MRSSTWQGVFKTLANVISGLISKNLEKSVQSFLIYLFIYSGEVESQQEIYSSSKKACDVCFSFQSTSPEPEQSVKSEPSKAEDQSLLQRWFPGWGGWYGGGQTESQLEQGTSRDRNVGEPPPEKISKVELGM